MNNLLAPKCGYQHGWCLKGPKTSCWASILSNGNLPKTYGLPDKCRYFSGRHPDYPTVTMNKYGDIVSLEMFRYDTIYFSIQEFDEAKPGIIKSDEDGYCETCSMRTSFWDLNVKAYVCSDHCRKIMYRKMEENSIHGE